MHRIKTKMIFIRHGQSIGNFKRLLLGHTDFDLSELGYEQAEKAALLLKDEKIDIIYSSDLQRAYNTAKAHEKYHGLKVIKDSGFREIFLGDWECADANKLEEQGDKLYLDFKERFGYFRAPGGESVKELGERIYARSELIANRHPGKTVLVGCHAAAIRCFFGKILGYSEAQISDDLPFPVNASISICEYDGEKFEVLAYAAGTEAKPEKDKW